MSVRVPLDYVDIEQVARELTFEYKKKDMMKRKVQSEPKKVACYTCITVKDIQYVSLPLNWAHNQFDIVSRRTGKAYDYKAVKSPWTALQLAELNAVVTALTEHKSVALTLRTGAGKTPVSLFAACHFKGLTVVLVHAKDLADQWANAVHSYTNAKCQIVDIKGSKIDKDTAIVICLYTRWRKVSIRIRSSVKLLIIDECDDFCNPTGMEPLIGDCMDVGFQPEMVLGCTATFKRPGTGLEVMMNAVLGTHIVTRTFDVKFTVNKVSTGIQGHRQDAKYTKGVDWQLLKRSLLDNIDRVRLVCGLAILRVEQGRKVMILCTENSHAKAIYETLAANNASCDWLYGSKKKTYIDSSILVVGTKKGGRGFDEENACATWSKKRIDCVMIVGFVNNETDLTQWIGRAFRAKDPLIDHFVDDDSTIRTQWSNMVKVYKWMKATIQVVNLQVQDTEA